ncbi:extracellular serine-rich protein [Fusarium sporotrichioides]|jgi:plastocyanin|uniref:Extracellular serine-rich protein n=1 Tax=Fusarium sporotrichioides TaxID=5514 RepID=A0A395RHV1_FUSSP|nr:extracellular serine-rich protein [Fusarium sporotrichioides]
MHASPITLLALSASVVSAAKHMVKVGDGGLTFEPAETTAKVGDTVEFHFYKGTHNVAQSSFGKPCEPINSTAFFSGTWDVKEGMSDKVFTLNVTTEDPIWYYCAVGGHCQAGMVGAINAPTSGQRSYANFAKAAEDSDDSVAPRSTGGGEIATATGTWAPSGTSEATGTSTETSASSTETSDANAGLEARGEIRWGLMTAGMAMAGLFGGLMM